MDKKKTIRIICVAAVFALIGILIIVLNKFSFNVNYSKNVRLEVNLNQSFDLGDIIGITNEVFEGQVPIIRKGGSFDELVAITVKETSDEQNEALIEKINEKFEKEYSIEDLKVYYNSNVKGTDLISPFIGVGIIATLLILAFYILRYKRLGIVRIVISVLSIMLGAALLYAALTSLFYMEINEASIAMGIAIEIFCLSYIALTYEKELARK